MVTFGRVAFAVFLSGWVGCIAVASPENGDDCGSGVQCFPCVSTAPSDLLTDSDTEVELNCSNTTQLHPGICQHNPKGKFKELTV
jgi:hypothetical protein